MVFKVYLHVTQTKLNQTSHSVLCHRRVWRNGPGQTQMAPSTASPCLSCSISSPCPSSPLPTPASGPNYVVMSVQQRVVLTAASPPNATADAAKPPRCWWPWWWCLPWAGFPSTPSSWPPILTARCWTCGTSACSTPSSTWLPCAPPLQTHYFTAGWTATTALPFSLSLNVAVAARGKGVADWTAFIPLGEGQEGEAEGQRR